MNITARKIDTGRSAARRFVVELLVDGVVVDSASGNRAARANAVIVYQVEKTVRIEGLRADLRAAQSFGQNWKSAARLTGIAITETIEGAAAPSPTKRTDSKCPDCKHAASNHYTRNVGVETVEECTPGSGIFYAWGAGNESKRFVHYRDRDGVLIQVPYCHSCLKAGKVCHNTRESIRA